MDFLEYEYCPRLEMFQCCVILSQQLYVYFSLSKWEVVKVILWSDWWWQDTYSPSGKTETQSSNKFHSQGHCYIRNSDLYSCEGRAAVSPPPLDDCSLMAWLWWIQYLCVHFYLFLSTCLYGWKCLVYAFRYPRAHLCVRARVCVCVQKPEIFGPS